MVIPTENAGAESHHSIGNLYKVLVSRGSHTLDPIVKIFLRFIFSELHPDLTQILLEVVGIKQRAVQS